MRSGSSIAGTGDRGATRRELLRGGIAAGAIAGAQTLLGGAGAGARSENQPDVVRRVLGIEQVIAFSYAYVLRSGVLSATWARVISPFSSHEHQHVQALSVELDKLGGGLPVPPRGVVAADESLTLLHVGKRLTELRSERDAVELLIGVEAAIIGAYYVAIAKLLDPVLLRTAAQTMADEAQHAAILRRLLHPYPVADAVPDAFVEGRH